MEGTSLELLIGALLPMLLEISAKFFKGSKSKFIVSLLVPLAIGAGMNWGSLSVENAGSVLESGAIIFAASASAYKLYFKDSKLQRKIAK